MRFVIGIFAIYLLLFIGLAVAFANQAAAAPCLMWPELQSGLTERYGEAPVFVGRGKDLGQEVAVYAAPQGTWTLIVRQSNGLACVLGAGDTWAMLDPDLTPPLPGTEN